MHARLPRSTILAALGAAVVMVMGAVMYDTPARSADSVYGTNIPAASAHLSQAGSQSATAVLAGGCFWGMEEVFSHVKGVTNVVSGYAGGDKAHANYEDSSSGRYGDAEAVRITYDPARISYADLLRIYFSVAHDPTQVNRQGPDRGPQYRSEVFAANADQARVARAYIQQLDRAHVFHRPIATRVSVGQKFFPAESYHQNYALKHPGSYYLRVNDEPKVAALKTRFPTRYSPQFAKGGGQANAGG
ncbi:peptide-methionine (S)-S-oxide reductase MsrA [Salinisphaera sp. LB1]|uniref:peptide-methionine (S)-S-oxide reductase MsrA n=1 Tax=Salinisphaera sp. LB1 TaxID=2183911 RepID=UPI000D705AD3|nr:peptide-methionine (S)-S-oxide reductase MsrA [Salinisphaera sp. LB1]AWN16428.1 Peptide methionine sulfoxide reductase MsrA [Salinisphaera sp. LB1]